MIELRRHMLDTLPRVIAHRGASAEAPENTLAAIRLAHRRGARWVEVDVKLSADGRCFLLHDATVDRTTNGKGAAARLSWDALRRLDAGSHYSAAFAGERLPGFDEFIDLLAELGMGANIEIKPSPGRDVETGERVGEDTIRVWPKTLPAPLLSSFSEPALIAARRTAPGLPRGLLVRGWNARTLERLVRLDCQSLHINHVNLSMPVLTELRRQDIPVLCYTVNDKQRAAALIRSGAASIITDWPREIGDAVNSV